MIPILIMKFRSTYVKSKVARKVMIVRKYMNNVSMIENIIAGLIVCTSVSIFIISMTIRELKVIVTMLKKES